MLRKRKTEPEPEKPEEPEEEMEEPEEIDDDDPEGEEEASHLGDLAGVPEGWDDVLGLIRVARAGGEGLRYTIKRTHPARWQGRQVSIGRLPSITEPMTPLFVEEKVAELYGGGRYAIALHRANGQRIKFWEHEVAGSPADACFIDPPVKQDERDRTLPAETLDGAGIVGAISQLANTFRDSIQTVIASQEPKTVVPPPDPLAQMEAMGKVMAQIMGPVREAANKQAEDAKAAAQREIDSLKDTCRRLEERIAAGSTGKDSEAVNALRSDMQGLVGKLDSMRDNAHKAEIETVKTMLNEREKLWEERTKRMEKDNAASDPTAKIQAQVLQTTAMVTSIQALRQVMQDMTPSQSGTTQVGEVFDKAVGIILEKALGALANSGSLGDILKKIEGLGDAVASETLTQPVQAQPQQPSTSQPQQQAPPEQAPPAQENAMAAYEDQINELIGAGIIAGTALQRGFPAAHAAVVLRSKLSDEALELANNMPSPLDYLDHPMLAPLVQQHAPSMVDVIPLLRSPEGRAWFEDCYNMTLGKTPIPEEVVNAAIASDAQEASEEEPEEDESVVTDSEIVGEEDEDEEQEVEEEATPSETAPPSVATSTLDESPPDGT